MCFVSLGFGTRSTPFPHSTTVHVFQRLPVHWFQIVHIIPQAAKSDCEAPFVVDRRKRDAKRLEGGEGVAVVQCERVLLDLPQ